MTTHEIVNVLGGPSKIYRIDDPKASLLPFNQKYVYSFIKNNNDLKSKLGAVQYEELREQCKDVGCVLQVKPIKMMTIPVILQTRNNWKSLSDTQNAITTLGEDTITIEQTRNFSMPDVIRLVNTFINKYKMSDKIDCLIQYFDIDTVYKIQRWVCMFDTFYVPEIIRNRPGDMSSYQIRKTLRNDATAEEFILAYDVQYDYLVDGKKYNDVKSQFDNGIKHE